MNELITIPKDITKATIRGEAVKIIDLVNNGEVDAMRVHLQIKVYEEIIKSLKSGIKDAVFDAASSYVKDDQFPAIVQISQTGDRIDYGADQEYSDIKKALKRREEVLKTAYHQHKNGAVIIDNKTGEVVPVCPAAKESEAIVKLTFRK